MLKMILLMTRGIILDVQVRRWTMFVLLLGAMVMIGAGTTFLAGEIATPYRFLIYWGVCGWLTLAALLLALWDLIMLRIAARKERIRLEKQVLNEAEPPAEDEG